MIAEYMMIDEESIESLMDLSSKELSNTIFELAQKKENKTMNIDKLWDMLHFLLTGKSASQPIDDDCYSEAVVGIHMFSDEEDADFIAATENEELEEIIHALEAFDPTSFLTLIEKGGKAMKKLYPSGIAETPAMQLADECRTALKDLLEFYKEAQKAQQHIIVSIL